MNSSDTPEHDTPFRAQQRAKLDKLKGKQAEAAPTKKKAKKKVSKKTG